MKKKCTKCSIVKDIKDFYKKQKGKNGRSSQCKKCKNDYDAIYRKNNVHAIQELQQNYYKKNSDKIKKYQKKYNKEHPEKIKKRKKKYAKEHVDEAKEYHKEYYKDNEVELKEYYKEYYQENADEIKEHSKQYKKDRIKVDPLFKLCERLRNRTNKALKVGCFAKTQHFKDYIGCTPLFCKEYLEAKFLPGMTWENYGFGYNKWHVDHIIPLSSAKTAEEVYKLCHYTNLQPLWQPDNFRKGKKIPK